MRFICEKPAPLSSNYTFVIPQKFWSLEYELKDELDEETKSHITREELMKDIFRIHTISDKFSNFKLIRQFIIVATFISQIILGVGARLQYDNVKDKFKKNKFLPNISEVIAKDTLKNEGIGLVVVGIVLLMIAQVFYFWMFNRILKNHVIIIRGCLNKINKHYSEKGIAIRFCQNHIRWVEIKLDFKIARINEEMNTKNLFYNKKQTDGKKGSAENVSTSNNKNMEDIKKRNNTLNRHSFEPNTGRADRSIQEEQHIYKTDLNAKPTIIEIKKNQPYSMQNQNSSSFKTKKWEVTAHKKISEENIDDVNEDASYQVSNHKNSADQLNQFEVEDIKIGMTMQKTTVALGNIFANNQPNQITMKQGDDASLINDDIV